MGSMEHRQYSSCVARMFWVSISTNTLPMPETRVVAVSRLLST